MVCFTKAEGSQVYYQGGPRRRPSCTRYGAWI